MAHSFEKKATVEEENARLRAENERLRAEIEKLKALLEELRRGQKRQAAPFSKGAPQAHPRKPGRKPGAAYGRRAYRRIPRQVDEVYHAPLPACCPFCRGPEILLEETAAQYQTEIPRRPIHRRFDVEIGHCACCGKRVQGRHPLQTSDALGAAASQLGPDAQALAVSLNKEAGLSHGKVRRVLQMAFGIDLSRGGSAQVMLRAAVRCASAYREILIVVRQSDSCVPDETGWRVAGLLQWLHVFVTKLATLYLIRPSRGGDVGEEALGADYRGHLTHDGWAPYNGFLYAYHGQCNAHLLRRCDHLLETATRGAVNFPRQVKALLLEALAVRDARENGSISLPQACAQAATFTDRLAALCGPKTHAGNGRLAAFLHFHLGEVFNYLRHPEIDATNWRAEQAIRPAVVNRKVWGGNRTQAGADAQGVLTSVLRTAAQQGQQALDFLSATLRASLGCAPHLILPDTT
jgi:transposase